MITFSTIPIFTFFYTIDGERWFKRSSRTAQIIPLDLDSEEKLQTVVYFKQNKLVTRGIKDYE